MRLLQSLKLQPRRTIRAVLWTGHEQGAIGSAAYVKQHLRSGVRESARTTSEFEKFSAYFAAGLYGKIRGVSEEGNAAVEPIFHDWIEPFKHDGMTTVTICRLGGLNDHDSFRLIGLPAFRFVHDTLEFNTRTHHSSADVYERL